MDSPDKTPELQEPHRGLFHAARGSETPPVVCPHCNKTGAVLTWQRDFSSDGRTEFLGHVCLSQHGGCGKHFDTERATSG